MSAFALDEGVVYHTYSAYARGLDGLWGMSNGTTELRSRAMRNGHPTTRSTSSVAMTSTNASDPRVRTRQQPHHLKGLSQVSDNDDVLRARIALLERTGD